MENPSLNLSVYQCKICLFASKNRSEFRCISSVRIYLLLLVPELKTSIQKYTILCERCAYFLNCAKKFREQCLRSQLKLETSLSNYIEGANLGNLHKFTTSSKTVVSGERSNFRVDDKEVVFNDVAGLNDLEIETVDVDKDVVDLNAVPSAKQRNIDPGAPNEPLDCFFICKVCAKCHKTSQELSAHTITAHTGQKVYHCNYCSFSTILQQSLAFHQKVCQNTKKNNVYAKIVMCHHCQIMFADETGFAKHVEQEHLKLITTGKSG